MIKAIEFQELYRWRIGKFEPEFGADLPQGVIKMREVMDGHVAEKRAPAFRHRACGDAATEEKQVAARLRKDRR